MACPFSLGHDGVDVDSTGATTGLLGACIELDVQGIEGAEHKGQLGPEMAVFDQDDPLATDADSFGESGLIELELLTPVANDGTEVGRGAN
jgi:hypothetical protein